MNGEMINITSSKNLFYIGDVCHILSEYVYNEIWGNNESFRDGKITFNASNKELSFIVLSTEEDGCFKGLNKNYLVDAGNIGIVPAEIFDEAKIEKAKRSGHFIEGRSLFVMKSNGKIIITDNHLNTVELIKLD